MNDLLLFPFQDFWWFYAGFTLFVLAMLALDLGVFHKEAHEVACAKRRPGASSGSRWRWPSTTCSTFTPPGGCPGAGTRGARPRPARRDAGLEFLAGYVVEKALAVDNIFVFVAVFSYFAVPPRYQHRVLFYGILGALVFRALFISLGAVLMQYKWVCWCSACSCSPPA